MKIEILNSTLTFKKHTTLFTSFLLSSSYLSGSTIMSSGGFKCWVFKNETNNAQTWRIFNAKENSYGSLFTIAGDSSVMPAIGTTVTVLKKCSGVAKANVDVSVTIQPNHYLVVSDYAFAYSGDMIPDISVNGEVVPLPTA